MADDVGTVARIFAQAALPMTSQAQVEIDAFARDNRRGRHGRVLYDLEADFGLDPATVRRRFDFYFARFSVRAED
jgi:hypothetical protein